MPNIIKSLRDIQEKPKDSRLGVFIKDWIYIMHNGQQLIYTGMIGLKTRLKSRYINLIFKILKKINLI